MEACEYYRGGAVQRPHPHASRDSTKDECFGFRGVSEREEQFDHPRAAWEFEI